MERLEEIFFHPSDKTFNSLHDKGIAAKKELAAERTELARLLAGGERSEEEINSIRKRISQKHDELMEILKTEEKISREIQERTP